jgi:hypothetical protein
LSNEVVDRFTFGIAAGSSPGEFIGRQHFDLFEQPFRGDARKGWPESTFRRRGQKQRGSGEEAES